MGEAEQRNDDNQASGRRLRGSTVQGIRICTFGAESKRQYSIKTMSAGREERDFKAETCASKSKERWGRKLALRQ